MKKQIIWEPQFYSYIENESIYKKQAKLELEEEESKYKDDSPFEFLKNMSGEMETVMQTPFGVFRVDDEMNPYRQFQMWMAHTNFNITQDIVETIRKIPGVELLQVITRYRFIVAFGQVFDSATVKHNIQSTLCGNSHIESHIIEEKILTLKEDLKDYPKWSIYVFPNGNYSFTYLKNDKSNLEEYQEALNKFQEAASLSQGKLISHDS